MAGTFAVSIPEGTIKRTREKYKEGVFEVFQYPKARLKARLLFLEAPKFPRFQYPKARLKERDSNYGVSLFAKFQYPKARLKANGDIRPAINASVSIPEGTIKS